VLVLVERLLSLFSVVFLVIGAIAVVGLMGITLTAVAWRYFLNDPVFGIEDLSVVTLTFVAGAAVAFGARHNAHVSVDVISYIAGRKVKRYTDVLMRLCVLGITVLSSYALFTKACGFKKACVTGNLSIEHRYFYYFLGISMGFYALHMLIQFLTGLAHFSGEDPNEKEC